MRKRNKQNKKRKGSQKPNYSQIVKPICLMPPPYISQENRTWTVRSVLSGSGASQMILTATQLAAHLGIIATAATTSILLCDQFRVRRVCVWGPVTTAGTPVTVALKYVDDPASNTQAGPPKTMSGTSSNINEYAYACLEPPKDNSSIFSQWCDASLTTAWINVTAPLGSILQIWYNFIIDDIGNPSGGPAIIAGTVGTIYHKNMVAGAAVFSAIPPLNTI